MTIQQNISLKQYNTFGIDSTAAFFAAFTSVDELQELTTYFSGKEKLILGGGSNILFTKDYAGAVLKNSIRGIEVIDEDDEHIHIKAGSGEMWHPFVLHCIHNHYAGVENLSLIPGCVGASPMQNIGAYGVEIKDIFHSLEAFHIQDKKIETFTKDACAFGYRESVFKNKYKNQFVITSVTYKLYKQPRINISYGAIARELEKMQVNTPTIKDVSDAVSNIRRSKLPDPTEIGNAGSFFKNPVIDQNHFQSILAAHPEIPHYPAEENKIKIPAGWLIEKAGWKGYRKNDYGVHARQALVLVNYGNAKGKEIYNLSEEIISDIYSKFDIQLEREVNMV